MYECMSVIDVVERGVGKERCILRKGGEGVGSEERKRIDV